MFSKCNFKKKMTKAHSGEFYFEAGKNKLTLSSEHVTLPPVKTQYSLSVVKTYNYNTV